MAQTRRREVFGPGVGSVAIIAKPIPIRPSDFLIQESRRQEAKTQIAKQIVEQAAVDFQRTQFEHKGDIRIKTHDIQRRVAIKLGSEQGKLQARRDRLRDILKKEEQQYLDEVAAQKDTPLQRDARNREKHKQLVKDREDTRLEYVDEQLNRLFLRTCEPLRTLQSYEMGLEIAEDRKDQVAEKQYYKIQDKLLDQAYHEQWEETRLDKEWREKQEKIQRVERNKENRQILEYQQAQHEAEKVEEAKRKEQEQILRLEEIKITAEQERRDAGKKRAQQIKVKDVLDRHLKETVRNRNEQIQMERDFDIAMLEQLLQVHDYEREAAKEKKEILKEDMRMYREYLVEMKAWKQNFDNMITNLVKSDMDRAMQKRIDQWDREEAARKKTYGQCNGDAQSPNPRQIG